MFLDTLGNGNNDIPEDSMFEQQYVLNHWSNYCQTIDYIN